MVKKKNEKEYMMEIRFVQRKFKGQNVHIFAFVRRLLEG
jgi:hypothetical protein